MDTTEPINLPAIAERIGGNLPEVLQWEQHSLLPRNVQYAISVIVRGNPELNTESRVDMLADMASFHGENIDQEVEELIKEHGSENVYLAIDWLYEVGMRSRSGGRRADLRSTVQMFDRLRAAGIELDSAEGVENVVSSLGGLAAAKEYDADDIIDALGLADRNGGLTVRDSAAYE